MKEFRSIEADANKIRMLRAVFRGTFLLVEGISDRLFYDRLVNKLTCQIVPISGKPSSKNRVISVLQIFENESFYGVLAIVDADFDRIISPSYNSPNLLRTDTHDLETMLIQSVSLDKIVSEFVSENKIETFQYNLRQKLLTAAAKIGYLRLTSEEERLNLKFDNLTFSHFINEKTLELDEVKFIKEIQNKSNNYLLQDESFQQRLRNKKKNSYDPWQICCGHDLVAILSVGLRKVLRKIGESTISKEEIKPDSLERDLRLAYEFSYFCNTQLYKDIRKWENNNPSFQVLPNEI
ncbi:DUF4435 domain-containing protein [Spirulina sp. 06S082]|uniref:DUF4435 domain-containing protein n=1 Tax=Spirulina sp. 06S082 TaxID=3110248 RepID=UPI002B220F9A|nr:DUF4435 domain-containing protein [Spirulina sp. 06S082]MEA5470044.1 DUF4435 domain-containing protein [Spirulina sp. 06S082]